MKYHLVGIGGVGMSALATALAKQGHSVTGADRMLDSPNISALKARGIKVFADDGSAVDDTIDEVIVSTAIESTNLTLLKAKSLNLPIVHRATALAKALESYKLVAVVGTCGKSTVTAMLGHILSECAFDPMCVNGANVVGWDGAVLFGRGEYAVAEVDESDKSLVAFKPYAAIVTNSSADHYSKAEMDEVFDNFIKDLPGPVVDARGEVYASEAYDLQNASLAIRMAVKLGVEEALAHKAMASFPGVERRLQRYGARVYDDYAHNPEKLRAMWMALAKRHVRGLCAVWRPHGYAPLRKMKAALGEMFNEVIRPMDKLLLLPVYDAGGTTDRSINSDALFELIDAGKAEMVADLDEAYEWIKAHQNAYEAFVTAGARDVALPHLAKRIERCLSE